MTTQTEPRIIARLYYDHGQSQRAFSDRLLDAAVFAMSRSIPDQFRPQGWKQIQAGPGTGKGSHRMFDHDEVADLGRQGIPASKIAERIGSSGFTVRKILKAAGITPAQPPKPPKPTVTYDQTTVAILVAKRRQGLSYRNCGTAAKVSHEGARQVLKGLGM